jgi:hypothetical protein
MSPMKVRLTLSRYAPRVVDFVTGPATAPAKPTVGNLRGSLVWGPDARECFRCERAEDLPGPGRSHCPDGRWANRLRMASCS